MGPVKVIRKLELTLLGLRKFRCIANMHEKALEYRATTNKQSNMQAINCQKEVSVLALDEDTNTGVYVES